jgi:[protein-PII] uridylyltransferase
MTNDHIPSERLIPSERPMAVLDQQLSTLAATRDGDAATLRAGAVLICRAALDAEWAAAETELMCEQNGFTCARRLSVATDNLICALHRFVTTYVYPADNPSTSERLAIAATGGYGRGKMAPGSDIDLLFILPYKQTAWSESVIEAILYILWDLKLKVGHATRSIDECIREGRADMTIRTSLLEARFLIGDRPLFDEFERRFDKDVVAGTAPAFVEAKLAERETRVSRAGSSRYLVEPNVKDGKGGLRDLHTLFWIAKYVYRVRSIDELSKVGLFTSRELTLFRRCEEFLWRVRCHLHFLARRPEERLSFDIQRKLAERLGFSDRKGLSGVERFMKRYFLVAKDVGDLTAIVCAALEARQAKHRPVLDRVFGSFRRRPKGIAGYPQFRMDGDRLTVKDEAVFQNNPIDMIRLFHLADKLNVAIHPDATRLVARSLKLVDAKLRQEPEANQLFVDILTSRRSPETVLRRMNEAGVLGRFVPEFGKIVAMMQFNMYHHYTVDEHLLRSIGVLTGIDAGRLEAEHPLANSVFSTITYRRALYVALFLHDVAKGRDEDHSIAGARIARQLGPRMGLTSAETETVSWLIEHHLDMSTIAQSRDLSDPATIEAFAAVVQTLERLKLLLVLTVCDIKAVGPGVWNGWKGELLRTLYYETEVVLAGGHSAIERGERVRRAQHQLRERMNDWSEPAFAAYAARHYPAYWLKVDPARKEMHARLLIATESEGNSNASKVATDSFRGVTEITVLAPDHPRLLAILTGACAAAGGNIVDAQIFTTVDGLALDTLFLSRAFERDDDELRRGERIAAAIQGALKGEVKIADLVAARRPKDTKPRAFTVASEVIIDNALSPRQTIIEVSGLDRPGLLYELTTAIGKLNLNIASAHIATFGEKAVDVFYVVDLTGAKIVSPQKHVAIRRVLTDVLDGTAILAQSA